MLLYEESKILERTMGEEAAGVLARVFERRESLDRAELATKEDLRAGAAPDGGDGKIPCGVSSRPAGIRAAYADGN